MHRVHMIILILVAAPLAGGTLFAAESPTEPADVLTLPEAVALALTRSPELSVYPYELRAAEARVLQKGLPPNPELEVEVEEFGGSGDLRGFDAAEASIAVGQPIELAGKRAKRRRLAVIDRDLVERDYEAAKLDVVRDVTQAFVAVQAAQERLTVAERLLELARRVQSIAVERVAAGKDAPVEELQADVVLSRSRIERQKAGRALEAARYTLAAKWGAAAPAFEAVAGEFFEPAPPVSLEEAVGGLGANPDLVRREVQEQRSLAALRLEQARAVPDVTVGGGVLRFEETDSSAFLLSLSIPLPLFDRNQGGIREALAEIEKTRRQSEVVEIGMRTELVQAVTDLAAACEQAAILREQVLPKAQEAFALAEEGFREGKFDYLYVLETERTLFDIQVEYIDAVETCHRRHAEVDRLTGGPPLTGDTENASSGTEQQTGIR